MTVKQNTIAIIFDFDDTLADDTITSLLREKFPKVNVVQFWKEVDGLVKQGWDPTLAYMKRMVDLTKNKGPLAKLTKETPREFASSIRLYPGVKTMFGELREFVAAEDKYSKAQISIKYYLVTGGLEEVVRECEIADCFDDIWGCSFHTDPESGVICFPKCVMSFTEKTRCLFQINKGVVGVEFKGKPGEVNKPMKLADRPVPFSHMIFVGDGLTDMACMSVLKGKGGLPLAVFDIEKLNRPEYQARSWLLPWLMQRGLTLFPARYGRNDTLRITLEGKLKRVCDRILQSASVQ